MHRVCFAVTEAPFPNSKKCHAYWYSALRIVVDDLSLDGIMRCATQDNDTGSEMGQRRMRYAA